MSYEVKVETTTRRNHSVELNKLAILDLLKTAGVDFGERLIGEISVKVTVPGGGDWSGMDLDLDNAPVRVEWVEVNEGDR